MAPRFSNQPSPPDPLPQGESGETAPASAEPLAPGRATSRQLLELAAVFLRLGATAFGGPAAHVGMMEQEFVRRRRWVSEEQFLDMLGAVNLIPGPNSTEMAIYIGYRRAGFAGLLVSGACFIVPAMAMVLAIAWAYVRFGSLPQFSAVLYGIKPVVIAIIAQALWGLGRKAAKTLLLVILGSAALAAGWAGLDPLLIFLAAGVAAALYRLLANRRREPPGAASPASLLSRKSRLSPAILLAVAVGVVAAVCFLDRVVSSAGGPPGLQSLFLYFLKIGSVLYGGGYVLLAFLQGELVDGRHWLTSTQLLDATAVGQLTPGPLFTTATFIGYLLHGPWGALVATLGIFLPSFVLIALSGPLLPRLRNSALAGAFLDGVNIAALALMAVVTWNLARTALVDGATVLLAAVSLFVLIRFRISSAWLILLGATVGWLLR